MASIHDTVAAAIAAIGPGVYGVACSGGADSMALADAAIATAGAPHVVVITIDHGLATDSASTARGVAAWARERGATAVVERVELARRASIEAAARDARYAAFDRIADQLGLAAILLGHTARDQAETVVMRILRGTGPAGLAAIPNRRGRFVRPLLALDRVATERYAAQRELPIWDDPMNDDLALTRVRIRRDVMPLLRRENARLDAALLRLAASAAEWVEVIDGLATPFARFPIACSELASQPAAIRKRAISLALAATSLECDGVHLDAIDAVVCAAQGGARAIDVRGGSLVRCYDLLDIQQRTDATPQTVVVPIGYILRRWMSGDRMRPLRLKGRSRKLSDLYADARLPKSRRTTAHVLVRAIDQVIVWAEHVGVAHASILLDGERDVLASYCSPSPTRLAGSF